MGPKQDVVYGLGFMDLGKEPVVLQVPDFGDRFWVYAIYDQRPDQVDHDAEALQFGRVLSELLAPRGESNRFSV